MSEVPNIVTSGVEAGPSSSPDSRSSSPAGRTLRRPASHGRLAALMLPGRSRSSSTASQNTSQVTAYAEDAGPGSSGRTTPEQRRRMGKAAATSLLASDAKYKKFAAQIDRCLQSFDSVNEWADFISFLSRLLKTLQTPHPPYSEIPRKLIISKRLAQCLNPALPSGVHQRALDVYAFIFKLIGTDGLRRDLLIWSSGLFPFFQFAATSVRPLLLNIYETYYLPLGNDLRPATKAIIVALLPGMEEETGDFFDRVLVLFDRISTAVLQAFFLQTLFLVLISSPASRLSALNYLAKRMLKPPDPDEIVLDVGLLVRGVSAVLEDANVLVRRNGLDLLLRCLRLDGPLLSTADERDKELLVRAATSIVLQRDVSLSRRVYTWFLGTDESPAQQAEYFKAHGLALLCGTLEADMAATAPQQADLRPFKILVSLLDRWEIGSPVSEKLALTALGHLQRLASESTSVSKQEVMTTLGAIYEGVEPSISWRGFHRGIQAHDLALEELLSWLLRELPQHDEEVNTIHAPYLLREILDDVLAGDTSAPGQPQPPHSTEHRSRTRHLDLALQLLRMISLSYSPKEDTSDSPSLDRFDLYEGKHSSENIRVIIKTQTLPHISLRIFDVNHRYLPSQDTPPPVAIICLSMMATLIDAESNMLSLVDSKAWVSGALECLSMTSSFEVADRAVSVLLQAAKSSGFKPRVDVSSPQLMAPVLDALFGFLTAKFAIYHGRAVDLIWECNQLAQMHTLENVVARRLSAVVGRGHALDAFGALWRQTDDAMTPGEIFFAPLCTVLDDLSSKDPDVQQPAETWLRCNLRSYFRALDPLLIRLLHAIDAPDPDLSLTRHLLTTMATLFRFGGNGLSKACQTTPLANSSHHGIVRRAAANSSQTYQELLMAVLLSNLVLAGQSNKDLAASYPQRQAIQAASLDILQLLISRGDSSLAALAQLKECLAEQLGSAIRHRRFALQSKMLHVLQAALTSSGEVSKGHRRSPSTSEKVEVAAEFDLPLVRIVGEAISTPSNRPVMQHWVDFVLNTTSQYQRHRTVILSLCEAFSQQVKAVALQLRQGYIPSHSHAAGTALTDAEPSMLLSALERLLVLGLGPGASAKADDTPRQTDGGSSILGLVSGVFAVEAPALSSSKERMDYIDDAIESLLVLWAVTADPNPNGVTGPSRHQVFSKTRSRAKKVLEKLFKLQPGAVMRSCVNVWAVSSTDVPDAALFNCVDTLAPSAQRVVELLSELSNNKASRMSTTEAQADPALLAFLEAYISRLEGPIAVQVWNTTFGFARDLLGASTTPPARAQLYPALRCITLLAKKVSSTSALEDRRLRRDLQDVFVKLLDTVVGQATRIADLGIWERGPAPEKASMNGETGQDGASLGLYTFVARLIIPNLRILLVDPDRVAAACASISNSLIQPAFKQSRVTKATLDIVQQLTKIPSAAKSWRLQVGDAFSDNRFFTASPVDPVTWRPIICALFDSDKERFGELLGRISAVPSANIFTNREVENTNRCFNLRRLSFALLAAERNHYLTTLPSIQEKLVELLRTEGVVPKVESEVWLCLRVLMCRISAQHLTNFWPVILTELLQVFEGTMDEPPPDGSDQLVLVLAACKFLDLLLVIQSEDFQVHQWMFVTDTTDAAFPPDGYDPEAIMDRFAEILAEHKHFDIVDTAPLPDIQATGELSRPRLSAVRSLSSLYQLRDFFARASLDTFEGVYGHEGVDWDAVEDGLNAEIFDA